MAHLQVKFNWDKNLRKRKTVADTSYIQPVAGSSAAAKSRRKLKESKPEAYKKYLAKDAERKREDYALTMSSITSDEKMKECRAQWAEAKREQRKKQREQKRKSSEVRSSHEKYMAKNKRESRQRMSSQKKTSVKISETERRRIARRGEAEVMHNSANTSVKPSRSRMTVHRRTIKAKSTLPKSPRTFATVVANIVNKATPRKQKELVKRGVSNRKLEDAFVSQSIKKSIGNLREKMTEEKRRHYNLLTSACTSVSKYGMKSKIAVSLGIGGKMKKKGKSFGLARKKRKDAIPQEVEEKVQDFWTSPEISHVVPLKKRVKKGQPLHVLECNYMEAFQKFRKKFAGVKIGYVKFVEIKPPYVKHMKALERSVCCCMKCENIRLKLKAVNAQLPSTSELSISSIEDLSKKTLCPYDEPGFPEKACVDRGCSRCGTGKLNEWYSQLMSSEAGDPEVEFDQWKIVEVERLIRTKGKTKPVKKKSKVLRLVTGTCTRRQLLMKMINDMKLFSGHLFRSAWQQEQFRLSKQDMPPKSAVLVADFAENYACAMQDEVQSYHWAQTQVTIHPIMAFLNASHEPSAKPTNTEAVFCITDDPKHDAAAVETFMQQTNKFLKEKYDITSEVLFSDCAASQYRERTSFADMSFTEQDHGISLTRHFFESSHGKSAADGLNAIVKHAATVAVTRGKAKIRNAKEFFSFCCENLKEVGKSVFSSREEQYKSASRTFFYVQSTDINRDRPDRDIERVAGTMNIRSVWPSGVPYEIKTRSLSCFCKYCRQKCQSLKCENINVVGEWKKHTLHLVAVDEHSRVDTTDGASSSKEARPVSARRNMKKAKSVSTSRKGKSDRPLDVKEGEFVSVKLATGKRTLGTKIFMAEVLDVDGEEIHLKYMKATSTNGQFYIWPEEVDISWQTLTDVVCKMSAPTLANQRSQFIFKNTDITIIKNMFKSVSFH